MKILQINTADFGGGAEGSAYKLFDMYRQLGHQSVLAVGTKYRDDGDIVEIPRIPASGNILRRAAFCASELARKLDKHSFPGCRKMARILARLSSPLRCRQYRDGLEETDFPGCHKLLDSLPFTPDIVHIHNMHGWFFDIGMLPQLSAQFPTILNLRDTWALTGHCAYFMDCEKWRTGCGNCPRIDVYPALRKDGTAQNWRMKADVYAASHLYVCAPSQWLIDCAKSSMLKAAEYKVIPNGIDTTVFTPGDKALARQRLDLPADVPIVMFASAAAKTVFKDQDTLRNAVAEISHRRPDVHFICVGAELGMDAPNLHTMAYISSPAKMADCYRAADVFLHTAKAEAFGKTVTEAMACGTPAVASGVGGLLEQILPGETGFLAFSPEEHASQVLRYLELPPDERRKMEELSAKRGAIFSLERQANSFLEWYASLITQRRRVF
ncbi:MAG: glycosyltransferase [Victivallales bacterium]|nr:glycosyltransferase [Victivallales bacterium]